jgi:thiamine biosynthesis lipoprotein ApbE
MDADALATVLSVLSPQEGIELVETLPQTCARIVQETPEGFNVVESECFKQLMDR